MMPFAGGLAAEGNALLLFSFAAALLYFLMLERAPSAKRTLIKAASVGLLAVLAHREGGPDLLVAALAFSALGDAALAQEGDRAFVTGLGAFLLAHIAYAALFATAIGGFSPLDMAAAVAFILFGLAFGAVLVRKAGALALPVAAYVLAITAMGVTAAGVGGWVLAGAALFAASDALIGTGKFLLAPEHPLQPAAARAVWALYWLAQAVLVLAVLMPARLGG
jgi:uncharacterized membrane protein YhhN